MQYILPITVLACSLTLVNAELESELPPELPFANYTPTPQPKEDIPLGYEIVTGFRSSFIHRGENLADDLVDFQLNGFFSYKEDKHLEYGIYLAGALGDDDFGESSISFNYSEEYGSWTYAAGANLRYFELNDDDTFTAELNFSTTHHFNRDHQLTGLVSYDTDEAGFYGSITYKGFTDLNSSSFLSYQLGVSAAYDYYGTDGFRDTFGRISYTKNITKQVSVSPFAGFSITRDDEEFLGGLWVETSF